MNINGYTLKGELKNANSGFSKWGFATKNGKEYFIKELINPVYPIDKSAMSSVLFEQRRKFCSQYEKKFKSFYNLINKASRGNLIRIHEFFRCGSRYYLITEKVEGESPSVEYIASLVDEKKLLLLKTVAHCFYDLHSAGIVHSDVKPDNILIKHTKNGNYVAKLIDFDSGYIKGDIIDVAELGGELTYLSPETFLAIYGENVHPDEKSDIFSLGLVFHEYYCGFLPYYDRTEYEYPYEVALDGKSLIADRSKIPHAVANLIESMLNADSKKRPSAEEIIKTLNVITNVDERPLEIKQIILCFGGAFGKSISIYEDAIKYRNTVHPSVQSKIEVQKEYYPADYLEQKQQPIDSKTTYDNIITKIVDAGLWDLVTQTEHQKHNKDKVYQEIGVICEDGSVYYYSTADTPDVKFTKIVSILSNYCIFPEKLICEDQHLNIFEENNDNKARDWFKTAGDL